MFHSHTLKDLSSDVDTNRRFLISGGILLNNQQFKQKPVDKGDRVDCRQVPIIFLHDIPRPETFPSALN